MHKIKAIINALWVLYILFGPFVSIVLGNDRNQIPAIIVAIIWIILFIAGICKIASLPSAIDRE